MEAIERGQLEDAVKDLALSGLNMLIAHNIKGADLIKKGVEALISNESEIKQHWESLKVILNMLKPIFDVVRDWIASAYAHLLELWDWAKRKWHEIFG